MITRMKSFSALLAVLAIATAASAQSHTISNGEVGVSGATLFEGFFQSQAITNDHLDVDTDNVYSYPPADQLAPAWTNLGNTPPTFVPKASQSEDDPYFYVHYRGTSSGSGFSEVLKYDAFGTSPTAAPGDDSYINRTLFYDSDAGSYVNGATGANVIANARVDIAIMDVPTTWITQQGVASNATPTARPGQSGYGYNAVTSWDQNQAQQLKSLTVSSGATDVTYNTNTSSPDSNTLFDTQVAYVPVSIICNPGVLSVDRAVDESSSSDFATTGDYSTRADGKSVGFSKTQMQTLFATGRMDTGENLFAATRNGGSGTRNAAMNGIGLDPSWGRGENVGIAESDSSHTDLDGVEFNGNFMESSSRMQEVVSRSRLSVGYQGMTKAESKTAGGKVVEHVVIMNDLASEGGDKYVFPNINNVVDNGDVNDGWRIGGNETMMTVGDPTATSGPSEMTGAKIYPAEFINNITYSIDQFAGNVGSDENYFMPGEFVAVNYMASGALQANPKGPNGQWVDQTAATGDGTQVTTMANFIKNNSNFQASKFLENGLKAPVRDADFTFDDGASGTTGYRYYDATSATQTLGGGQTMNLRNTVQGDFSGDDIRDINDIAKMMECVTYTPTAADTAAGRTNAILAWAWNENATAGDHNLGGVMPHIIGDFNNDGNMDAEDVRYFADGLAYDSTKTVNGKTGLINRVQAFQDVDTAFGGNYFGTTFNGQTPSSWTTGASQFDVAGSDHAATLFGATPGAAPYGSDGDIDGYDISYVQKVLAGLPGTPGDQNSDSKLSWLDSSGNVNLLEAISMDLSVDFDGDFDNDAADLQDLFDLLETGYGDANLDGAVGLADLSLQGNNYGATSGAYWEEGDFNGDGAVSLADLSILGNNYGSSYSAPLNGAIQTPEPTTMALLGLGGLALLRRRRRN